MEALRGLIGNGTPTVGVGNGSATRSVGMKALRGLVGNVSLAVGAGTRKPYIETGIHLCIFQRIYRRAIVKMDHLQQH